MSWKARRTGFTVALLLLLGTAGCTGSDVLTAGNGTLQVLIAVDNNNTRFDVINFRLLQIELRPVDPTADTALGAEAFLLLNSPHFVNFFNPLDVRNTVALTAGVYRISKISARNIIVQDEQPPASAPTCEEYVASYVHTTPTAEFVNFGPTDVTVIVEPNTASTFTFRIDAAAFVEAFQQNWNCQQTSPGVWALGTFNLGQFTNANPNYFSFD